MALTPRQRAFIEAYSGNATEAAKAAGYSPKTAGAQGHRLLKDAEVAAAIRSRQDRASGKRIASREERQAFWTSVQDDTGAEMAMRLRASELLGKSEADFTEKIAGADGGPLEIVIRTVAE